VLAKTPLISVLITTYNRSRLLRRAIGSVLMQSFGDFEIVVIDDCSADDTPTVVASIADPRIRYYRNETNQGAIHGDRIHVRRFLNELMRGKYFCYLCDDDYWLPPTLLERQIALFQAHPHLAFVFGNQLSYNLTTPASYLGGSAEQPTSFTCETIRPYFDLATNECTSPYFNYFKKLYPKAVMTSEEYLTYFSKAPTTFNRADGGTLYSRPHFMAAGAMRTPTGSQWQAGFEFKMGPACVGGVAFLDEPALLTEIREQNASFNRTQVDHYLDSVKSIDIAMSLPMAEAGLVRRWFLQGIKAETLRNLTRAYLRNTIAIRTEGSLGMCSAENMAEAVTAREVVPVYLRDRVWPTTTDLQLLCRAEFTPRNTSVTPSASVRVMKRFVTYIRYIRALHARGERQFNGE
jgi:hypothetical protein